MKRQLILPELPACSCVKLTSKQGLPYWFRTCDLHSSVWDAGAHVVSFPAGTDIPVSVGSLRTRYPILGITYNGQDSWLLDGINREGLTGGLLLLEEGTSVSRPQDGYTGVMGMELVTALLAVCRDIAEVCDAARTIRIVDIPIEGGNVPATMHYFFADAAGHTAVLEAADPARPGQLQVYHADSIGVMTNSPPYPRQLDNLRWFLSQSPELHRGGDDCPITQPAWEGVRLSGDPGVPHLTQSGVLPASYAPYDRFVRLAVLKALNHDGRWMEDGQMLPLGSGLMRTVFEPHSRGVYHYRALDAAGMPTGSRDGYTQYTVMYDLHRRELYLQPYDATAWTRVALQDCSSAGIEYHPLSRDAPGGVVNSRSIG